MRLLFFIFITALVPLAVHAETLTSSDINNAQHIVIKPDSPVILKMDNDVGSVIIGNPDYVRAIVDTPRTLILMPESSGSTTLSIMGASGETLLEKRLIVSPADTANYLAIKRACINSDMTECVPLSLYYCPDRCHAIGNGGTGQTATTIPAQNTIEPTPQAEGS